MKYRTIELLAPAQNSEFGIEAINHGADAVYIGAPQFSARAAAGNSVEDIEKLCRYAHQYHAKVHVALNTLLFDYELESCQKIITQLYEAGADALIIQDLGILKLNLPPIALHASTQMDNRTVEQIQTIEKLGFQRAILARELSLQEIRNIRKNSHIELEAFVHGSLCVCYSGQCYLSEKLMNRSANRGNCAQPCRLPYSLYDADNKIIAKDRHLLSLKDMDRSEYITDMIDAGISSLKIEGRLKNMEYVKNITAFYRQKIDTLLAENNGYRAASFGKTTLFFQPDSEKTFHRGKTDYFLTNDKSEIFQLKTPKSIGEKIGTVKKIFDNNLIINTIQEIHNGDGLVYFDKYNGLQGFRVNKVENGKIYPLEIPNLRVGQSIYRNYDHLWNKQLQKKSAERKLALDIHFQETDSGFTLSLTDEAGNHTTYPISVEKEPAKNADLAIKQLKEQLQKLGNTIYYARNLQISISKACFFPVSQINDWRKSALQQLQNKSGYSREEFPHTKEIPHLFDNRRATYLQNILNNKAQQVYTELGYSEIEWGFEYKKPTDNVPLMFCKHCIKYALGYCSKQTVTAQSPPEPWIMQCQNIEIKLTFNCAKCEMFIQ